MNTSYETFGSKDKTGKGFFEFLAYWLAFVAADGALRVGAFADVCPASLHINCVK